MKQAWVVRFSRPFLVITAVICLADFAPRAVAQGVSPTASRENPMQVMRLEHEAAGGNPAKELHAANYYFKGDGVPKDIKRAAFWYEKAAVAGDPVAENMMGYLSQAGLGMSPDPERSLHWYKLAAASGLPDALLNVGLGYLAGAGTTKDPQLAAEYFERALAKGVSVAASYLGTMALAGIGQSRDVAAAETWYRKGVKLHDAVSEYDLGLLYSTEPGHTHDALKAVAFLRASSDSGYVPAMHSLAVLVLHHPELGKHEGDATELLERAASAGYWRSSMVLGVLARDGDGVAVDRLQAYVHFRIAELQGGQKVAQLLQRDMGRLQGELSTADVQQLDAGAATWVSAHPRQPYVISMKIGKTLLLEGPASNMNDAAELQRLP